MANNEYSVRETYPSNAPINILSIQKKLGLSINTTIEYNSFDNAIQAFNTHSYNYGYNVFLRITNYGKKGNMKLYICDRERKQASRKDKNLYSTKKHNIGSRKTGCEFRVNIKKLPSGKWKLSYKEEYHNYKTSDNPSNHPANRTQTLKLDVNIAAQEVLRTFISRITKILTIRATMKKDWDIILTKRDIYNIRVCLRTEQLGGLTAIQWLVREFEERHFFVQITIDKNNRVTCLFFAYPECIKLWHKVPDVILINTTYKTNWFGQLCVNVCGSLGNNMTPQLAICFLSGEDDVDYAWVLEAMKKLIIQKNINTPKLFITNRETTLINTFDDVFPDSNYILCRWHVNMNIVANYKKHFEYQENFEEFFQAWLFVIDTTIEEMYETKLTKLKKLNTKAIAYVEKTWLKLKKKLIVYWVNQVPYYGNHTTFRNKSSHATIKVYLGTSSGDHKYFFDAIYLFWEDQHRDIIEAIRQIKIKPRVTHNILFFQDIIAYVHPYTFNLILKECGIPCQHIIRERQNGQGLLQLSDINRHWYYDYNTANSIPNSESRCILFNPNPANVKKKGRPKGTKKKLKKRGDVLPCFESTNFPPAKHTRILPSRAETSQTLLLSSLVPVAIPAISKRNTRSTTKLAFLRGIGGPDNPYQPGTKHKKAYMRSIYPDKLVEADILGDNKDSNNSNSINNKERTIDTEIMKYI